MFVVFVLCQPCCSNTRTGVVQRDVHKAAGFYGSSELEVSWVAEGTNPHAGHLSAMVIRSVASLAEP